MAALTPGQQGAPPESAAAGADVGLYDFLQYVGKKRMISFWYHLVEIMQLDVNRVLEVGVGPGVVSSVLRGLGKDVKTADINPALKPDYLVPVQHLSSVIPADSFDLILCARVLHYVSPGELAQAFAELHQVTRQYLLLTLPVDELRLSFGFYVTARPWHWASIPLPLVLKKVLLRLAPGLSHHTFAGAWKLGCCAGLTRAAFEARASRLFTVAKSYPLPEAMTHHLFLLRKRALDPPAFANRPGS